MVSCTVFDGLQHEINSLSKINYLRGDHRAMSPDFFSWSFVLSRKGVKFPWKRLRKETGRFVSSLATNWRKVMKFRNYPTKQIWARFINVMKVFDPKKPRFVLLGSFWISYLFFIWSREKKQIYPFPCGAFFRGISSLFLNVQSFEKRQVRTHHPMITP